VNNDLHCDHAIAAAAKDADEDQADLKAWKSTKPFSV
jgi:hypothetical protein